MYCYPGKRGRKPIFTPEADYVDGHYAQELRRAVEEKTPTSLREFVGRGMIFPDGELEEGVKVYRIPGGPAEEETYRDFHPLSAPADPSTTDKEREQREFAAGLVEERRALDELAREVPHLHPRLVRTRILWMIDRSRYMSYGEMVSHANKFNAYYRKYELPDVVKLSDLQ